MHDFPHAPRVRVQFRAAIRALLLVLPCAALNAVAADVTLTEIETLGGNGGWCENVNEAGHITGSDTLSDAEGGARVAFFWSAEKGVVPLPTVGGHHMHPAGISESDQVAGTGYNSSYRPRGFSWSPNGDFVEIAPPGGDGDVRVTALNDNGMLTGYGYIHGFGSGVHAFSWSESTGLVALEELGNIHSYAFDVNNAGQIAGEIQGTRASRLAVIWDEANGATVITPDSPHAYARAINEKGHVTGRRALDAYQDWGAYLWTPEEGLIEISTPDANGGYIFPQNLNDHDQVAGYYYSLTDAASHAFFWSRETGMVDIGTIGLAAYAYDINNDGVVIGDYANLDWSFGSYAWSLADGVTTLPVPEGKESWSWRLNDKGRICGGVYHYDEAANRYIESAAFWDLTPPTPEQQVADIASSVAGLLELGNLSAGIANALTANLETALAKFEQGNVTAACNALGAFINQVNAKTKSGKLSAAEGEALSAAASGVSACE